jgi:hypothetical protein
MKTIYIGLGSILVFVHLLILYTYIAGGEFVFGLHFDWIFLGLSLEFLIFFVIYLNFADRINDRIIKSFKILRHNKLFYISGALTIVATIFFIFSLAVQYGDGEASRIGKSTKDGFIFYVFLITFLVPTISWLIYYLAIKKGPALTKVIKDSRKIKDEKNQVVKRSEVVKQIKEAKELLDLGILTQAEYDELIKKLKPIILNN